MKSAKKSVCIAGTGYVGLVAGSFFADKGFKVVCSTLDEHKVDIINSGKAPFYEKDLDPIVEKVVRSGMMRAVRGRIEAIRGSDLIFISVGTPSLPDGSCDLSFIKGVAEEIGKGVKECCDSPGVCGGHGYKVVVVRSTVIPGTTRNVVLPIIEKLSGKKAGKDFGICMSPEFLRQGDAVQDTYIPDRLVIGEHDEKSGEELLKFYRECYGKKVPILRMSMESAELVKYASNSLLATKISFTNEIANIAEKIEGIDVTEVMKGVGLDSRIGPKFLNAGAGFGGSCFPKDVKALMSFAKERGCETKILSSVMEVNAEQARHTVDLVERELGGLSGKTIAMLGLSFKPDTDDMREAPSVKMITRLLEAKAKVKAYDPVSMKSAEEYWLKGKNVEYAKSAEEALKGADAVIIATEWPVFKEIKPETFRKLMKNPLVIDGRRIYDTKEFSNGGVKCVGIGRK